MSRPSIWNAKFDRDQDFVVSKPFRVRGIDLVAGDTLDKTMVTTRTLRQLYESRKIRVATVKSNPDNEFQPADRTIRHIGRGRFAVFRGETRITEQPLTKDEAVAYAEGQFRVD
jgi:hypothetical protein